jgi:hypothetical protein
MRSVIAVLLVLALFVAPGCGGSEPEASGGTTNPWGTGGQEPTTAPFGPPTPTSSPFTPPSTTSPTTPAVPTTPAPVGNKPPVVAGITVTPAGATVAKNGTVTLNCAATDPNGDSLTYKWTATGGSLGGIDGSRAVWVAPDLTGSFSVTVTVTDGKDGSTTAQQTFTVVANAAPAIGSLTATPASTTANGRITVAASVSDPDGDTITYRWTADGGIVTGVGSSITWQAPDVKPGEKTDFVITLTVDDGRGGQDLETVHATVTVGYGTKEFSPVAADTGTSVKEGGDDMTSLRAGDTVDNEGMRTFVSFNLAELHSTDVSKATVTFTHKETFGDPFKLPTGLRGIHVYVVRYEPGGLPEYFTTPVEELTKEPLYASPTTFDVTKFVQRIGQNMAATDQLQFMLAFQRDTNNDAVADGMAWSKVSLSVTFAPD